MSISRLNLSHSAERGRTRDYTKALGRFRLGQLVFFDIQTKITHEVLSHLRHGRFGWIEPKVQKNISARFGDFRLTYYYSHFSLLLKTSMLPKWE